MGQVTRAINARSGLIASSDTPERRHQSATKTIQQTSAHECGNNMPWLALPPHFRVLTPIFGSYSKHSIGGSSTTATCRDDPIVVRSADHTIFARSTSFDIFGHLKVEYHTNHIDRCCGRRVIAFNERWGIKCHDRKGDNRYKEFAAADAEALGNAAADLPPDSEGLSGGLIAKAPSRCSMRGFAHMPRG